LSDLESPYFRDSRSLNVIRDRIGTGMLFIIASTGNELLRNVNIVDFE